MAFRIINFGEKLEDEINLALGFFDAVHYGHAQLIARIRQEEVMTAVCVLDEQPAVVFGNDCCVMHTLEERLHRLQALGVDCAIVMRADQRTLGMSGIEFIGKLIDCYNIKTVAIGEDYTCGKAGAFNACKVYDVFTARGIKCITVPLLSFNNGANASKISSSVISEFVRCGNIVDADKLMPLPFMITGVVVSGRKVGAKEVYPTANIEVDAIKLLPKDGVYVTAVEMDGKRYKSITNIGFKPTFNEFTRTIETYVLDYSGNMYGRKITLYIIDRIRDVIKFTDASSLKSHIDKDIAAVLNCSALDEFVNARYCRIQ